MISSYFESPLMDLVDKTSVMAIPMYVSLLVDSYVMPDPIRKLAELKLRLLLGNVIR